MARSRTPGEGMMGSAQPQGGGISRSHTPNPLNANSKYAGGYVAPHDKARLYTDFDPDEGSPYRRMTNQYAHQPNFGSLPRRHATSQSGVMSSSAQV